MKRSLILSLFLLSFLVASSSHAGISDGWVPKPVGEAPVKKEKKQHTVREKKQKAAVKSDRVVKPKVVKIKKEKAVAHKKSKPVAVKRSKSVAKKEASTQQTPVLPAESFDTPQVAANQMLEVAKKEPEPVISPITLGEPEPSEQLQKDAVIDPQSQKKGSDYKSKNSKPQPIIYKRKDGKVHQTPVAIKTAVPQKVIVPLDSEGNLESQNPVLASKPSAISASNYSTYEARVLRGEIPNRVSTKVSLSVGPQGLTFINAREKTPSWILTASQIRGTKVVKEGVWLYWYDSQLQTHACLLKGRELSTLVGMINQLPQPINAADEQLSAFRTY